MQFSDHIESFASHEPEFALKIIQSFYVDGLGSGGQHTEETFGLCKEVKKETTSRSRRQTIEY